MPRLSAIVQRAAQRASVKSAGGSLEAGGPALRSFCDFCLSPLTSEDVRSRHVANSPFCREAEAAAISNAGLSAEPQPTHTEPTDDTPKSVLVDSIWDDLPAYITDEITRAFDELSASEGERHAMSAEGTTDPTGVADDLADGNRTRDDGEGMDGERVADKEVPLGANGAAAEVSVVGIVGS